MSTPSVAPAKVKSALKTGSTTYVADVDGRPFVGNQYFATAADTGPARDLLAKYNVPADYRGRLEVNGTVTTVPGSDAPKLAQLIPTANLTELRPYTIPGARPEIPVYVHGVGGNAGRLLAVYTADDGRRTYFDDEHLTAMGADTLHQIAETTGKYTVPALTAAVGRDRTGRVVGVVMSVRVEDSTR